MRNILLILVFTALGCSHVTINRSEKSSARDASFQSYKLYSFAWGLVPRRIPPEAEVCPNSKIESVHLYQNVGDVWLAIVTFGIYVPHRAEIVCASPLNGSH